MAQAAGTGPKEGLGVKVILGLVTLFCLPLLGAGWGARTVFRWHRGRGTEDAVPNDRAALGAVVGVVSVVASIAIYPSVIFDAVQEPVPAPAAVSTPLPVVLPTTTASQAVSSVPAPVSVVMPDLRGVAYVDAVRLLDGYGHRADEKDASARGRLVFVRKNWTVVDTFPAVGKPIPAGIKATLYLLRNEEAAWFAEHQKMPRLPAGKKAETLGADGGILEPVRELVLIRYAPGRAPKDATDAIEGHGDEYGSGTEPEGERKTRAKLKSASSFETTVVGSVPAAGKPLRPGQFIVVTVKDGPKNSSSGGDSGSVPDLPNTGDDDDDVDIPGWVCPTRFC